MCFAHKDVKGEISNPTEIQPTDVGVPQGGPISPTISNMILNGIEKCVDLSSLEQTNPPFTDRKYLFSYNKKEFMCTLNCRNTRDIQAIILLQSSSFASTGLVSDKGKSGHANYLINYKGVVNHDNWQVSGINCYTAREGSDLGYFSLHRFADDCLFFVNSDAALKTALEQINQFLAPRGLKASPEKLKVSLLPKDSFSFVGYDFSCLIKHGKTKCYSYPPLLQSSSFAKSISKVLNKIKELMPPRFTQRLSPRGKMHKYMPKPYNAFRKANLVLNGWANYYRVSNAKKHFSYIGYRVFHIVRKYLLAYLSPTYTVKRNKRVSRSFTALYEDMWKNYLIKPPGCSRYWGIKKTPATGRYKDKPLQLLDIRYVHVATPSIITGLNAYHANDSPSLLLLCSNKYIGNSVCNKPC